MKKWIIGIVILMLLGYVDVFPFTHADAGVLCVPETLLLEADDSGATLYSIDGVGRGETILEAAVDLMEKVPGDLFLRQVKRLIFCGGAEREIDPMEIPEEISPGAHIYMYADPAEALLDELEKEEKRLSARERREKDITTLAELQNEVLKTHD